MNATPGETAALMQYMPIMVRSASVSDWERKFCASIIAASRKRAFTPSVKQLNVMRRMVEKFKAEAFADEPMIEDGP